MCEVVSAAMVDGMMAMCPVGGVLVLLKPVRFGKRKQVKVASL